MCVCVTVGVCTPAIQCERFFFFFAMCRESHHQAHNSDVPSQYLSCSVSKLFFLFSSSGMCSKQLGFCLKSAMSCKDVFL